MVRPIVALAATGIDGYLALPGALGATFGTVIPLGGLASDVVLDEARGVVYVANMTANEVQVVSTQTKTVQSSYQIQQPSSLALSPDGRYLVIAQYPNWVPSPTPIPGQNPLQPPSSNPTPSGNASPTPTPSCTPGPNLTAVDLTGVKPTQQWIGCPGLAVRFGSDGKALLVTTNDIDVIDPVAGTDVLISPLYEVLAQQLPQMAPYFPKQFTTAGMGASGDGNYIYTTISAGGSQTVEIGYYVPTQDLWAGLGLSSPPPGPRVISVNHDGSLYMEDWGLDSWAAGLQAQLPNTTGTFSYGTSVLDETRNLVYVQAQLAVPQVGAQTTQSILQVVDADNLNLREQVQLPENLIGTSVLDSTYNYMYAASDSGLMVLPVGSLLPASLLPQPLPGSAVYPQIQGSLPSASPLPKPPLPQVQQIFAGQEDVFFGGTWCNQQKVSKTFTIADPSGGKTDFTLSTTMPGITLIPTSGTTSGTTPVTITVTADMGEFAATMGTTQGLITITSKAAVNVPPPVRILVNTPQPDQRGAIFDVPGTLVDVLADPFRNRFYVVRQDKNEVLVFDGSTYQQIGTLRTGNTPMQIAMSLDGKYLLTTADNSGATMQYDLDTLQFVKYITYGFSWDDIGEHYPHSIAFSNNQILAASRVAGPWNQIDTIDLTSGSAEPLPTLGEWKNDVSVNTALTPSASGNSIFAAQDNGTVMLYTVSANTFVYARQDVKSLSGPVAALPDTPGSACQTAGSPCFLVDNYVLNIGLVTQTTLDTTSGSPSGFSWFAPLTLYTTTPASSAPGVIQKLDPNNDWATGGQIRMVESPLLGATIATDTTPTSVSTFPFTRTLAPLSNGKAIIALTTSGLTVLPWAYDAQIGTPVINRVENSADFTSGVAPGSTIQILGSNLDPITVSASGPPLPTVLGGSCALIGGTTLLPMTYASPGEIKGQWPFEVSAPADIVLYTPNGISNPFMVFVEPAAPAVFSTTIQGWPNPVPSIVRASNGLNVTLSNPIHENDSITIFVTGLGVTTPAVGDGLASPANPPAEAALPSVILGNTALQVTSANLVPGQVGVYEINAHVPFKGVQTGMSVPLTIISGDYSTMVDVRVVN